MRIKQNSQTSIGVVNMDQYVCKDPQTTPIMTPCTLVGVIFQTMRSTIRLGEENTQRYSWDSANPIIVKL